ncbi:hypothetical protein Tsubulata_034773 [Turnera subulata]|uniref:HTH myb-type domain-containing protein n=1 Tax=Turnera subulata TaxID=218843 RepID=A0A9Q0J241_9ROSI|nr:hypothetical protein Tsubulata_034773 [Turnera subulata]
MRELEDQVNVEEEEEEEEDGEEEDGEGIYGGGGGGGEEERVIEWEMGLPNADDLTPLSQLLIPPELASAFSISPEPYRTVRDVNRASHTTFSSLRGGGGGGVGQQGNALSSTDPMGVDLRDGGSGGGGGGDGSGGSGSKPRRIGSEEADSAVVMAAGGGGAGAVVDDSMMDGDDPSSARTLKRPRLVWTPQLHKRFVDVVGHLGIKNAVPKTIMQLMNVEGLTRENVASHLQKYRLYLKRMQGLSSTTSNDGASTASENNTINNSNNHNNHIFPPSASTAPENGNMGMPYHHHPHPHHQHPGMMPMPVYGHMGMQHQQMMNGFDGGFQYAGYGSVMSHHHHHHQRIGSNDNMKRN